MSNQPQIFSPLTQKEKIASDNISLELIDFLGKIYGTWEKIQYYSIWYRDNARIAS